MVFSDSLFLFLFLPIVAITFYSLNFLKLNSVSYLTLIIASLTFYYAGTGALTLLLIMTSLINSVLALYLVKNNSRALLILGIVFNLIPLFVFKYLDFFIVNYNEIAFYFQLEKLKKQGLILPIGISFYTFQAISYLVDVYHKVVPPLKNPLRYLLYISFFPQLVAGPIVRLIDVYEQILRLTPRASDISAGIMRFVWGLSKKVLIADPLSQIANVGFDYTNGEPSFFIAWLSLICYTLQIYFDFSGYSDMAIGIGRAFGLSLPRNFFHPYSSTSITDFWRRWHITLSSWFRDYLYIPLGGSRTSAIKNYRNLWIVFLVTGLWHGAAWTYVLWGAAHGLFISIERFASHVSVFNKLKNVFLKRTYSLFVVMIAWVLFRSESIENAIIYYQRLFNFAEISKLKVNIEFVRVATMQNIATFFTASIIFFLPNNFTFGERVENLQSYPLKIMLLVLLMTLCTIEIFCGNFRPFLYFQF